MATCSYIVEMYKSDVTRDILKFLTLVRFPNTIYAEPIRFEIAIRGKIPILTDVRLHVGLSVLTCDLISGF